MVETWKDALTKKQRDSLVRAAVKALGELVDAEETRDLVSKVSISKKRSACDEETSHAEELYLTAKGLEEKKYCYGHQDADMTGWTQTWCEFPNNPRKVPRREYGRVVKVYHLTKNQIAELQTRLQA